MTNRNICVVGCGFVGLVTGVYFAECEFKVTCVDKDVSKVKAINNGTPHFFEEGLEEKLSNVIPDNLIATQDLKAAILASDYIFLCVGTPKFQSGEIDLSQIDGCIKEIGHILKDVTDVKTFIMKSTVIPGTTRELLIEGLSNISGKRYGTDFFVAMNPEFLREGSAVEDTFNPDRIVVGSDHLMVRNAVLNLYPNVEDCLKLHTTLETAEISKYASNLFFASVISFSNEIANICSKLENVDVRDVFESLHMDRRIVRNENSKKTNDISSYIWPGIGFGGSCFPKDVSAMLEFSRKNKLNTPLLESVQEINQKQVNNIVEAFLFGGNLKKVALLGLSFKPGTDDVRESKSLEIIKILRHNDIEIVGFDPLVKRLQAPYEIAFAPSLEDAIDNVDGVILSTTWPEFKSGTFVASLVHKQIPVLDCRLLLVSHADHFTSYSGPGVNRN